MVIARELLKHLTERQVDLIFDLLEDPYTPLPREAARAIGAFLRRVEHELGEDHPAALEVRVVLMQAP